MSRTIRLSYLSVLLIRPELYLSVRGWPVSPGDPVIGSQIATRSRRTGTSPGCPDGVPVPLPRPRDLDSPEYLAARDRIFSCMGLSVKVGTERVRGVAESPSPPTG